jgi:hypothetical protein
LFGSRIFGVPRQVLVEKKMSTRGSSERRNITPAGSSSPGSSLMPSSSPTSRIAQWVGVSPRSTWPAGRPSSPSAYPLPARRMSSTRPSVSVRITWTATG